MDRTGLRSDSGSSLQYISHNNPPIEQDGLEWEQGETTAGRFAVIMADSNPKNRDKGARVDVNACKAGRSVDQ